MKKLFFFFTLIINTSFSQSIKKDSLFTIWDNTNLCDSIRLNAIDFIAWNIFLHNDPDSSLHYAKIQYDFAKNKGYKKWMATALNTQASSQFIQSKFKKALSLYKKSLSIFNTLNDSKGIANSLNNIGGVYYNLGDLENSIDYYEKSLNIEQELDNKKGIAQSLNNIGGVYYYNGQLEKALEYHKRSLKIHEEVNYQSGVAYALLNIGLIYNDKEDLKNALICYKKCLSIRNELDDKEGIASTLNNIGEVYQKKKMYNEALKHHNKSLSINHSINNQKGISSVLINLSEIEYDLKNYNKSIKLSQKALTIAKETEVAINIKNASYLLSKCYNKKENHKKSLEMFKQYITYRDSIQNEETSIKTLIFENDQEHKVKDAHIAEQAAISAKQKAEIKTKHVQQYALFGTLALLLIITFLIQGRFKSSQKKKKIIEEQHVKLEETHQDLTDSITYAKRIQTAVLPSEKNIQNILTESFVLYIPKDIVAGDFYWVEKKEDSIIFATADCTGHGVPGALVSVLGNNALNRSVREYHLTDPGKILDKSRELMIGEFEKSEEEVLDGMDIALCKIIDNKLFFAGANNPLWVHRNNEIIEINGDNQPIGKYNSPYPFNTHSFELQKNDIIYLFSDGYADQFGGDKNKKFKKKNLRLLIKSIASETMMNQKQILEENFNTWKGENEQIDDVCIMGVKI